MIKVGEIYYKNYSCHIILSKEIKKLLESHGVNPDLSKRFPNEEYFFENFLFQKPELKEISNFEIIYSNTNRKINDEFLLCGKMTMTDIENQPKIKWIVIKK